MKMYTIWLTGYVYPVKTKHKRSIFRCLLYWKVKILLISSQNYDSNISKQLLKSFKSLTILSIILSSVPEFGVSVDLVQPALHIVQSDCFEEANLEHFFCLLQSF